MADHGTVEYATATGNDLAAHEATYEGFVHLATVGSLTVVNIVICLAMIGTTDHWGVAFALMVAAIVIGGFGLSSGARNPIAIMTVVSLLALAVTA
jgi:hypothetical protein